MKIEFNKYVIATIKFPMTFEAMEATDDFTDYINDAYLHGSEEATKRCLDDYSNPEEFQILPVKVTYEI